MLVMTVPSPSIKSKTWNVNSTVTIILTSAAVHYCHLLLVVQFCTRNLIGEDNNLGSHFDFSLATVIFTQRYLAGVQQ